MYIASVCSDDEDIEAKGWSLWNSAPLTAHEADMIRSYIEFVCTGFYGRDSFDDFVDRWTPEEAKPYPVIAGHNTVTFLKRADDDWAYRRNTFTRGPRFFPQPSSGNGRKVDLLTLLDVVICGYSSLDKPQPNSEWEVWKAAHPEVFAAQVSS